MVLSHICLLEPTRTETGTAEARSTAMAQQATRAPGVPAHPTLQGRVLPIRTSTVAALHTPTAGGWSKTGAYGGTAYGDAHYGGAYYHPPAAYYPYHPPTTVNYYGSGCYNCGGWSTAGAAAAGAAVGMVAGAAIASSNTAAATSSAYSAGVAAGSASTAAATSSAYSAGVATGVASASGTYVMGALYPTLPAGCATPTVQGTTYYLCGNTWFKPSYGANGVFYKVVPTP